MGPICAIFVHSILHTTSTARRDCQPFGISKRRMLPPVVYQTLYPEPYLSALRAFDREQPQKA